MKFVAVFLLSQLVNNSYQDCGIGGPRNRVVGGENASPNSWPWQVSLSWRNSHMCGGTIIAPKWILTAAHCFNGLFNNPSAWKATGGIVNLFSPYPSTRQKQFIRKIIKHPLHTGKAASPYDLALVQTYYPFRVNEGLSPICLPNGEVNLERSLCYLTGWGLTFGEQDRRRLQQLKGHVVDNDSCNDSWGNNDHSMSNQANDPFRFHKKIEDSMLCFGTASQGGCKGDSGGPLVCRVENGWVQVGIVSWGSPTCKTYPTVFTRVSTYDRWIQETLKKN